ncbi:hypothetical protein SAMN05216319_4037 [Duganella sp. CF402]|uniref:hypothetical protein n=1 Tax=unclassified Duganella TaxID=2636909 RepID=UPI0008C8484E|nr:MULTISPECIES: hypothetical protein [unclassified Duganella]RZT04186.1 hypothetical protein EV582_5068 [Duganella sp. BK701]SEM44964.1 hypothetical protein SAMN05216319_4037 [Duganella sp. CF402]
MMAGQENRRAFTEEQIANIKKMLKDRGLLAANGEKVVDTTKLPVKAGLFSDIYNEIWKLLQGADVNGKTVDAQTRYWFSKAAPINAADVAHEPAVSYIKGVTQYGLEYRHKLNGYTQTQINEHLQQTSNLIGEKVLNQILNLKGVPAFASMISNDISAAIDSSSLSPDFQQDIGGWGGSFYYWKAPLNFGTPDESSVGDVIMYGGTSKNLKRTMVEFDWANGNALLDFELTTLSQGVESIGWLAKLHVQDSFRTLLKAGDNVWTALGTVTGAQAPAMVKLGVKMEADLLAVSRAMTGKLVPGPQSQPSAAPRVSYSVDGNLNGITATYADKSQFTISYGAGNTGTASWMDAAGNKGSAIVDADGRFVVNEHYADGQNESVVFDVNGDVDYVKGLVVAAQIGDNDQGSLIGGTGDNEFHLATLTDGETDAISDLDGIGTLYVGNSAITGANAHLAADVNTWTDSSGMTYQFEAMTPGASIGTLLVFGGLVGDGRIKIDDFDIDQAQTGENGYLGIKLRERIALETDSWAAPLDQAGTPEAVNTSTIGLGQGVKISVSAQSSASYKARIQLDQQVLHDPQGKPLRLTPGMQVIVEINQGRRTVLQYLLSPVQKTAAEAGHER